MKEKGNGPISRPPTRFPGYERGDLPSRVARMQRSEIREATTHQSNTPDFGLRPASRLRVR